MCAITRPVISPWFGDRLLRVAEKLRGWQERGKVLAFFNSLEGVFGVLERILYKVRSLFDYGAEQLACGFCSVIDRAW
jgi:hypothetical protein